MGTEAELEFRVLGSVEALRSGENVAPGSAALAVERLLGAGHTSAETTGL